MIEFEELKDEQKIVLLLQIAENLLDYFSKKDYQNFAKKIIKDCKVWHENRSILADDLYNYIDSADGSDISFTQEKTNGNDFELWDCYIYIVGYICMLAYEYEDADSVPQPIENVDDSFYDTIKGICEELDIIPEDLFDKIEKQFME